MKAMAIDNPKCKIFIHWRLSYLFLAFDVIVRSVSSIKYFIFGREWHLTVLRPIPSDYYVIRSKKSIFQPGIAYNFLTKYRYANSIQIRRVV